VSEGSAFGKALDRFHARCREHEQHDGKPRFVATLRADVSFVEGRLVVRADDLASARALVEARVNDHDDVFDDVDFDLPDDLGAVRVLSVEAAK